MKNWTNDYCLLMFLSTDDLRPALKQVSLVADKACAANGWVLARVPADHCMVNYPAVEKYPDVNSVIEKITADKTAEILTNSIFGDIMKLKPTIAHQTKTCEECDGDGKLECFNCGNEHQCLECAGTGEQTTKEIKLISEEHFSVLGKLIYVQHIEKVVTVAKFLGVEKIQIYTTENPHGSVVFQVGNFEILSVPHHVDK